MENKVFYLRDIMTNDPIVITSDKTALDVSEIFRHNDFHHLPVVNDKGNVVGIVSRTDLDQHAMGVSLFANQSRQEYTDAMFETLVVEYFMTKGLHVLGPNDTINKAYEVFKTHHFRAIPIVDEKRLVGIVTPIDLVKPYLTATT